MTTTAETPSRTLSPWLPGDGVQLRGRVGDDRILTQPAEGVEHAEICQKLAGVLAGALREPTQARRRGNPELRSAGEVERRRHDAYDFKRADR